MLIHESNDKSIGSDTDAYYEAVASQEEIYLEENEEELRAILESDDQASTGGGIPYQQRDHAVEELLTGDSDDPPLSEVAVEKMLLP
jgi:hypothetical protein